MNFDPINDAPCLADDLAAGRYDDADEIPAHDDTVSGDECFEQADAAPRRAPRPVSNPAAQAHPGPMGSNAPHPDKPANEEYAPPPKDGKGDAPKGENSDTAGSEVFSIPDLLAFNPNEDAGRLIGENRYLCAGGSMVINGQAGIGKSSLIMQAAVSWALGRDLFGIRAMKPLRILIVQRENDLGDMAEEVQGVIKGLRLTPYEVEIVSRNLVVIQESFRAGETFAGWLRRQIIEHKADFVFCDPLFAFALSVEQKDLTPFLRSYIQPILNETGCIICFVHHANKPPKDATYGMGMSEAQKKYMGSGSMETTNWARAVLTIVPAIEDQNIFELCTAKRGSRAGMTDAQGNPAKSVYIRHATDGIYWERAGAFEEAEKRRKQEAEDSKRAKASKAERDALNGDARPTAAEIVEVMGADEWTPGDLHKELRKHFGISKRTAESRLSRCTDSADIIKAPGKRGKLRAAFPKTTASA
jgi:hypothetical protein